MNRFGISKRAFAAMGNNCVDGVKAGFSAGYNKGNFKVRHIWLATFEADHPYTTPEKKQELVDATLALRGTVGKELSGGMLTKCGWDKGLPGTQKGKMNYCISIDFQNADDFLIYNPHPLHIEFAKKYISPYLANSSNVQLDI